MREKYRFDDEKSKRYGRKNYRKNWLNANEACKYLGCTIEMLVEMVQGVKGYPKLNYVHNKQDNSWKFSKEDLAEYRYWWDRSRKKRT